MGGTEAPEQLEAPEQQLKSCCSFKNNFILNFIYLYFIFYFTIHTYINNNDKYLYFKFIYDKFCLSIILNFIYLAVLALHCCTDFLLIAMSGASSLDAVPGLLIAVASLIAEHRL